ncbi:POTRA domain-containing protein [Sodalis sp. RH24]
MPSVTGDILNLRDIEQALENFTDVYNANADIKDYTW